MEETFRAAIETSPDEVLALVAKNQSRPHKAALKAALHGCSKKDAANLCSALARFADLQVHAFQNQEILPDELLDSFKTPSPKRKRRKRTAEKSAHLSAGARNFEDVPKLGNSRRAVVLANLRACALVACFGLSHPLKVFQPCDLFPSIQTLHDKLVLFEDDLELQDYIATLCEAWWRDHLPGRESLIAQSLPYLLSKSLEVGRKVNVHRVYAVREAFALFDFVDESIEDLKHLLMRCVLTPAYLRSADGRRFISFLFGLNAQLTKELIVMVRSQIPFGRKSILEAYGEILFRAWKTARGACLQEIQESCLQSLIEGAVYASTKSLASSIRKLLGGFNTQRTQEGVEALLFRLQEPVLFRSLQVANSNVRRNALLLLVDMFPLEDPDASKEENDILLDRQFIFLEKLLADPCPDVRVTAVEGISRVLRLFWEVVSSATTVRLLSKIVDETAQDKSSTAVRCAVFQGMTYLLKNPASHELLKVLLPRLGSLLTDCNLAVRVAVTDMLLAIKGIRAIPFLKVVSLESLLSTLAIDKPPVARRLTRLLIPSYFPSKVTIVEACNRCIALIKRSPQAGARFCEWGFAEGIPVKSLLELVRVLINLLSSPFGLDAQGREGIFFALNKLCHSLANHKELKMVLGELLTRDTLKSLLSNAATSASRTSIVQLVSVITPKDVPELFDYCGQLVTGLTGDALSSVTSNELRAAHSLMLSWGGFDDLVKALVGLLDQNSFRIEEECKVSTKGQTSRSRRNENRSAKSPWTKSMKRRQHSEKGSKDNNEVGQHQRMEILISAMGAAWHVENILEIDETRTALLGHSNLSELVSGLRNTVQVVMNSNLKFPVSDLLMASPIRAYATLVIHMAFKEKGVPHFQNVTSNESKTVSQEIILETCKDLLNWTTGLPSSSHSCNPVMDDVKSARTKKRRARGVGIEGRNSQHQEPLADISNTPCDAAAKMFLEAEVFLTRIKIANTLLQSLLYFFSLKLVKDIAVQDGCLELTLKLVQWVTRWLRDRDGQQIEHWKKDPGKTFKDILSCVRAFTIHAAKILYFSLRNDTEQALRFADLANHLLDLIIFCESLFGSKGATSVLTALRPWMPDLLISVSSSTKALTSADGRDGTSNYTFDELVCFGKRALRPWIASFASSAFQVRETVQNCQLPTENTNDVPVSMQGNSHLSEDSSFSRAVETLKMDRASSCVLKFQNRVSKLLRRGDRMVLEGMLTLFLWHAAVSLRNFDYSSAAGALEIICRKFLRCKPPSKKGLKIVLPGPFISAGEEISRNLDILLQSTSSSQSARDDLHVAKELVDTVVSLYKAV